MGNQRSFFVSEERVFSALRVTEPEGWMMLHTVAHILAWNTVALLVSVLVFG